jgi:hypothetical protein
MRVVVLTTLSLLAGLASVRAQTTEYRGLCEASAAAYIDDVHFVVASDDTNRLQIHARGKPDPVGSGIDMEDFTSFDKSDLEGAAGIGNRIYWISSHSFNKDGEDKAKRKVFFATRVVNKNGKPTLVETGKAIKSLRDPIAKAAQVDPKDLNIESLAATPEGGLLIGLRQPLRNGKAILIPFKNPAAVVENGAPPELGAAMSVNLKGGGFRSMELIGSAPARYAIVAGPVLDSPDGFKLFRWSGDSSEDPVEIRPLVFERFKPEAAVLVPGKAMLQLLSDDGDICEETDSPDKRRFKSVDVASEP